ncbi:SH3 domain-containing protein [Membranihabitans maritimus]|uniref:SH3 domain-containing protein n=1 Tax=Membranihabitans maritimus TaxID=2904244 RepID=UPI001F2C24D3|nr:SH3 domain-containing protein [Membranihabitans maritimus]
MSFKIIIFFSVVCVFTSISGCGWDKNSSNTAENNAVNEKKDTLSYARITVDNLRMRTSPDLSGEEITQIGQNQTVSLTGMRSHETESIEIRGERKPYYWYEIQFNGDTGWIYGGGMQILSDDLSTELSNDHLIIPGERVGIISFDDTEETLITKIGKDNIMRANLNIGEGETVKGTIVYPNSNEELKIFWQKENFEKLKQVVISKPGSAWQTLSGIHIGSSITTVTEKNGKPFQMTGFQWDYSGTVLNWQGGKLDENLKVSFDYDGELSIYPFLIGDKIIYSDNSSLLKVSPSVRQIVVYFD